jgi:transposase-like protein
VQAYGPELNKRCRAHLKPTNKSYRTDETYIKVNGVDQYLYRAVDSTGQTIDFLLTRKRDAVAAERFFRKALSCLGNPVPPVINVDQNRAYPAAVEALKRKASFLDERMRQCNGEEADLAGEGVWLVPTAWRTVQGIEALNMIRKGRARWVAKGDAVAQAAFVTELFDLAA